jgi:hypothetical protein
MTATTKLALELLAAAAAHQTLANTTFAQLNQLVMAGVVDNDLSTPPGSPANEALYIVAGSATGAWTGEEGNLAYWLDSTAAWQFIVPREGFLVHVNDENDYYKYTGAAWSIFSGGGGGSTTQSIIVACSDETTALTAGTAKVTFRMPYAFTLSGVRASLGTAQTSGSILTIDINEGGTTILSTKLTIDNTEKTSTTAAAAAAISDSSLADDAEITIDIDQLGDGTAKGLKVTLIGVPT